MRCNLGFLLILRSKKKKNHKEATVDTKACSISRRISVPTKLNWIYFFFAWMKREKVIYKHVAGVSDLEGFKSHPPVRQ